MGVDKLPGKITEDSYSKLNIPILERKFIDTLRRIYLHKVGCVSGN